MLDRLQLDYKYKLLTGVRILLYAFLVCFCFESSAVLELGKKNIAEQLNVSPLTENSVKPVLNYNNSGPETVGVVATVNGDTITVMDIIEVCSRQEARLPYIYKGAQLQKEAEKLRLQTLNDVIDRKLIYQEFIEKGYNLPKNFVEENLDRLMFSFNITTRKELEKQLKASGLTMAEFRENAYENLAVDLMINDRCFIDVFITPKNVYAYFLEHKSEFSSPEEIRLQVLKLKTDGVHQDELDILSKHLKTILKSKNNNEFTDAVLLYSEGPNIENGGDIGWINKSKLRKDFLESVNDSDSGDIVGPIKSKEGYYFLRVAEIRHEKTESFKQAKDSIKDKMTNEQKMKAYKSFIDSLRSKAYIKKY